MHHDTPIIFFDHNTDKAQYVFASVPRAPDRAGNWYSVGKTPETATPVPGLEMAVKAIIKQGAAVAYSPSADKDEVGLVEHTRKAQNKPKSDPVVFKPMYDRWTGMPYKG